MCEKGASVCCGMGIGGSVCCDAALIATVGDVDEDFSFFKLPFQHGLFDIIQGNDDRRFLLSLITDETHWRPRQRTLFETAAAPEFYFARFSWAASS